MDAVLSFARDARNWLIAISILLIFSSIYILSRVCEWALAEAGSSKSTKSSPVTPTPPEASAAPAASVAPEASISPYCLPDEPAEMRAWAAGLPEGTPIELDGAWFTPAEVTSLAKVWERAARALESDV